ncbi:hypothetical protein FACS1894199_15110 [Bacteroidia bacterium]|nr:hypothetical protein FACS1894199_15110 [Bacteroidia bacterium]
MKTTKKIGIAVMLLLIGSMNEQSQLGAKRVEKGKAESVAKHHLQSKHRNRGKNELRLKKTAFRQKHNTNKQQRRSTSPTADSPEPAYYVFNVNEDNQNSGEQGFIIVSGDDIAKPILGYSDNSTYDENNLAPNFVYWMECLEQEIGTAAENNVAQSEETKEEWDTYMSGAPLGTVVVEPLIKTKWNQSEPYYNSCPSISGTKTVTGCVATAMAQIMKYHNYPIIATKTIPSYTTITRSIPVNAVNAVYYDWENMINTYSSSATAGQKNAVATLMHHCGVSVEMDYNLSSSGGSAAYSANVRTALTTYFDYDGSIQHIQRSSHNNNDWHNLLKTQIDAGLPVYYDGFNETNTGHAFVCDGYDSDGKFHFNWGWGGHQDGYFATTALNPGSEGEGAGAGTYNQGQTIIINIKPGSTLAVTGVTLNKYATTIGIGNTEQLIASVKPLAATNKAVTWSSSNTDVATVSSTGEVTGVAVGAASITATTEDGGFTANCAVTISIIDVVSNYTFESGTDISAWQFAQTGTNKWYLGTATSYEGSRSMYISNNNYSYDYTITSTSVSHAYIPVTFASTSAPYTLTFKWKCVGESTFDNFSVYLVGSSVSPVSGTELSSSYRIGASYYGGQSSWQTATITFTPSQTNMRLVFTWKNDYSMSNGVPAAIDNVVLTGLLTPVTGVSLNKSSTAINGRSTETLTATVAPNNATNKNVMWGSSVPTIASVDNTGEVTGVAVGTATITATTEDGDYTATCAVTVNPVAATGVSLNKPSTIIYVGGTETLTASIAPSNATNPNVTWSSSAPTIASVDNTGEVTAVAAGTATITATTEDGGYTANCAVTVNVIAVTSVSLNKTATTVYGIDSTETLTATIAPSNATNKNVTWSSSNTAVATVSSAGVVTAVSAGSATITVTTEDGSYTASCAVAISSNIIDVVSNYTFESGTDISAWQFAQTGTNKWYIGTATSYEGSRSMYISNNSYSYDYTYTSPSVSHAYVPVTFASTSAPYTLTFKWKCVGESIYDNFSVYLITSGVSLSSVTELSSSYRIGGYYSGQSSWQTATITFTPTQINMRIVFTWSNDNIVSDGVPAAIDNVMLTRLLTPVTDVSLNTATTAIYVGNTETLTATIAPADATNKIITWSSSNTAVATVSSAGVVTAVSAGTANITATTAYGGYTATCAVTVSTVAVTGVSLNKPSTTIYVGGTETLTPSIAPSNATNQNVTWSSSAPTIASVDNTGEVTAVAAGTATITATTADGGYTANCAVTVAHAGVLSNYTLESGTDISVWQFAQTGTNKWYVGTATSYEGSRSMYISNNSYSYDYTYTSPSVSHAYVPVTFESTSAPYTLTFKWKCVGESTYDNFSIYLVGSSVSPVSGTELSSSYRIGASYYGGQSSWQTATITFTPSQTNMRLVFTWKNDYSMSNGVPAAIDNVVLTGLLTPVTDVSLNQTTTTLVAGSTETLTATLTPSNATNQNITWSSSNTAVAAVSTSGVVTAVAVGAATITATTTDGGFTANCAVTVNPVPVTSVSLNKTATTVYGIGNTESLTATVLPANAANKNVTWVSSNTAVAVVSTSGLVTAQAAGTAIVTATTEDGNYTATCTMTITIAVTGVTLNKITDTIIGIDSTEQLIATVLPANATNQTVTWSSSDTDIATVSTNGLVTTKALGTAIVTATTTDGSKRATCTITVTPIIAVMGVTLNKTTATIIGIDSTEQLIASAQPTNATNKAVTWSSSDTSVATVSTSGRYCHHHSHYRRRQLYSNM